MEEGKSDGQIAQGIQKTESGNCGRENVYSNYSDGRINQQFPKIKTVKVALPNLKLHVSQLIPHAKAIKEEIMN